MPRRIANQIEALMSPQPDEVGGGGAAPRPDAENPPEETAVPNPDDLILEPLNSIEDIEPAEPVDAECFDDDLLEPAGDTDAPAAADPGAPADPDAPEGTTEEPAEDEPKKSKPHTGDALDAELEGGVDDTYRPRPKTTSFNAMLDIAEIDDRERPGPRWSCRAEAISGSSIILTSRRMCYVNRRVVIAVHMIDDAPTPLFARVHSCDYATDGLYRVDLDLLPIPEDAHIIEWFNELRAA